MDILSVATKGQVELTSGLSNPRKGSSDRVRDLGITPEDPERGEAKARGMHGVWDIN